MLVSQILKSKDSGVITITPGATLREVVELLSTRRIGAVVVSSDGKKVKGIISERDIVRELGRAGPACLDQKVDSVMTRAIYGCAPGDTTDSVLETMTTRRFRHMPVMEDNVMVGFISIGDVVAARLSELQMERDALTGMIMGN
ncbi:MAG: CBS domain-containing protein [Proteobacteria bacterium]|uniref:Histidine kinase n=1 Tax=Pararhodobacter aggregans TaxID=404875 RepID=A0A2T7UV62_9RHOB|nr:CBS domain-containing protein [Pararhodobacter aggregans]MCA0205617.1 CBS domain-containing protein [Pseudomonadota bacterium]PTX03857.1 CBS domain protein [Pararhodobacter aggregans]PVE48663.1 histidine kinase [Pararhodobacter aggregans]